jgi:hypothetical protein
LSHHAFDQNTIIERSDTIQVEKNDVTGQITKSKIKWVGNCEYQLFDVEQTDSVGNFKPLWNGKVITTKILKAEKDYCVYEAIMEGVSMKMIDTLRILK